jgi:hypothetical protein
MMPFYRALLYVMDGVATHKTSTCAKEQICIIRGEAGQGIKGETVDGH